MVTIGTNGNQWLGTNDCECQNFGRHWYAIADWDCSEKLDFPTVFQIL